MAPEGLSTLLHRTLSVYLGCCHTSITHLWLSKDAPEPRPVHPPEIGRIIVIPQVGGLNHRYERRAA